MIIKKALALAAFSLLAVTSAQAEQITLSFESNFDDSRVHSLRISPANLTTVLQPNLASITCFESDACQFEILYTKSGAIQVELFDNTHKVLERVQYNIIEDEPRVEAPIDPFIVDGFVSRQYNMLPTQDAFTTAP